MEILFVENHVGVDLFHPSSGASQRSNLLLQACAKLGHVDVVMFCDDKVTSNIDNCDVIFNKYVEDEKRTCCLNFFLFRFLFQKKIEIFSRVDKRKSGILKNLIGQKQYDKIVIRYLPDAINCGLLDYSNRLIVDIDDNPVSVSEWMLQNYMLNHKCSKWWKWKRICELWKMRFLLPKILCKLNHTFVSNMDDLCCATSSYLPNIPYKGTDCDYCSFEKTEKCLLFVGLLCWEPNYNGVIHFLDRIYPLICKKIPDVKISIVGKIGEKDFGDRMFLPGVEFKGFVENLDEEYRCARVAIVPCYMGAGTNIKVLEAMAQKRPVVTTVVGSRGHNRVFENNQDYLVSESDWDFADKVISVLQDESENHRIASNAHKKIDTFYSKTVFFDTVAKTLLYNGK